MAFLFVGFLFLCCLGSITAATPHLVCFRTSSASIGPLAVAHVRHFGFTLESSLEWYHQQCFPGQSWKPLVSVSQHGGEEGFLGE